MPEGVEASAARGGAHEVDLEALERLLGHQFNESTLLRQALVHRSFANESEEDIVDNEVLEFLGDAVLGLVVSELLYRRKPNLTEGEMSKLKAFMVSSDSLARRAEEIELGKFLVLGKGEEKTAGRVKDSLLANAFEAVIAAVYLDGGLDAATDFVDRTVWPHLTDAVEEDPTLNDYKSLLQERLQAQARQLPVYRVVEERGPDHNKIFRIEVLIDGCALAEGEGKTKKAGEQQAAEMALSSLGLAAG